MSAATEPRSEPLQAERVRSIFLECLGEPDEAVAAGLLRGRKIAHCVHGSFALIERKLAEHRAEIDRMLDRLPEKFHEGTGSGWSFLQACNDRDGRQWTGEQVRMAELFGLGLALGRVHCIFPRDLWPGLPGGVPYYVVRRPA